MILSVIIVHYQVPYFLELCLLSVEKALLGLEAEILVVDNHSAGEFPGQLQIRFPRVKWIVNPKNLGFARANNQGLAQALGEYILFLNPDTVLPEDFARNCLAFFNQSTFASPGGPSPGGLGVRMIDGRGRFLKESRRGFPSPWVAFCKLSGLSALFPRSRWFSQYYLGWLPAGRIHPSPILSGACFWTSRAALESAGPFDERFFMYGEDIDLSYRLQKAGYINYYLAETTIIHFKGASTQKDYRYIRQFYKAMSQFRHKHFNTGWPGVFRLPVELGIRVRAALGAIGSLTGGRRKADPVKSRRIWLTGDPAGINVLLPRLTGIGRLAADAGSAQEIIFCQGDAFSFRELIAALQKMKPGQTAGIYAAGAHAVIGSPGRDDTGEIRIL